MVMTPGTTITSESHEPRSRAALVAAERPPALTQSDGQEGSKTRDGGPDHEHCDTALVTLEHPHRSGRLAGEVWDFLSQRSVIDVGVASAACLITKLVLRATGATARQDPNQDRPTPGLQSPWAHPASPTRDHLPSRRTRTRAIAALRDQRYRQDFAEHDGLEWDDARSVVVGHRIGWSNGSVICRAL